MLKALCFELNSLIPEMCHRVPFLGPRDLNGTFASATRDVKPQAICFEIPWETAKLDIGGLCPFGLLSSNGISGED